MKDIVNVRIKALHKALDDSQLLEFEYEGKYRRNNNSIIIMYESSSDEDNTAITDKNIITIKDDVVEHTKRGAMNTRFVFRQNECTKVSYTTAYGGYNMDLYTNNIKVDASEDRINLVIDYNLLEGSEANESPRLDKVISSVNLEIVVTDK